MFSYICKMRLLWFRLTILLLFISASIKAQYDTEHWLPALYTFESISSSAGVLHLSTGETSPFEVEIYTQNTLRQRVTISKDHPARIPLSGNLGLVTNNEAEFMKALGKGLHLRASQKFFANIRLSYSGGAALINSKGAAALGREFMNAHMPLSIAHGSVAFMTSVIATEDNTKVTISGFDPGIKLHPDAEFTDEIKFTLNRGESYGFAGSSVNEANRTGLIGAKITADKDIAVVNGAFNGQYYPQASNESFTTGQTMIDQSVPYTRLGESFIILRGFDANSDSERVFVMATEDSTEIYLNDESAPYITLNTGEYTVLPSTKYKMQRIGMYSMYIRTTKKVYTYQIASSRIPTAPSYAVGTFILIPPVSCYMPNTIDQISFVGSPNRATKLNILTQKGAQVSVNGVLLGPNEGPEEVVGNTDWGNFLYFPKDDHITVTSDKSVAVGLITKSNFGGYFAGFSSVPAISKSGDCAVGIMLSVDDTYDSYQWYKDGSLLTRETKHNINPELYGSGNYVAEVSKSSCEPLKTAAYVYSRCLEGIVTEENIGNCNQFKIAPEFQGSTEPVDYSKTQITYHPLFGTLAIDSATGELLYTPDPNARESYTDDFTYRIYGFGGEPTIQTFSVKIHVHVLRFQSPTEHKLCFADMNSISFNLTKIDLGSGDGNAVTFYENCDNSGDCNTPVTDIISYPKEGLIYAKVVSPFGCSQIVEIDLIALEGLDSENVDIDICLNPNETEKSINLSEFITETGATFFNSKEDAEQQQNEISSIQSISAEHIFYVRLQKGDCIQINTLNIRVMQYPTVNISQNNGMVTVNTTGGTPPFLYSIDDGAFTASNTFANMKSGFHTIRVKTGENCAPQEFDLMFNSLPNIITPNGDNSNDLMDFSEFANKTNVKINIFNRFGNVVFSGGEQDNPQWNGKTDGNPLPTGNYWYIVEWTENQTPYHINGWVLLKNR